MHLRKVPVHTEILGKDAQATEPDIKQIFIIGCNDQQELELKLYLIRKRVEKRVSATDLPAKDDFYIASLSTKNIVYKRHAGIHAATPLLSGPDATLFH